MIKKTHKNKLLHRLKNEWNHLDIAFKCIFVIGIILLFQLIYAIFVPADALDSATQIVFRTSTSSIFGFILGMSHPQAEKTETKKTEKDETTEDFTDETDTNLAKANNLRIVFSASICITCIIVLVAANVSNNLTYQEGVIQVRDLISTTIGFLISRASHHH